MCIITTLETHNLNLKNMFLISKRKTKFNLYFKLLTQYVNFF